MNRTYLIHLLFVLATVMPAKWTSKGALFSFTDYALHVGRMKGLPAFDDFEMRSPETILFGNTSTNARHFTNFSLQQIIYLLSGNSKDFKSAFSHFRAPFISFMVFISNIYFQVLPLGT